MNLTHIYNFNPNKKKIKIINESGSLGDCIAWLPGVDAFQKKHNCVVHYFTNKKDLFEIKHLMSNAWDETDAPSWMTQELINFLKSDQRNQNNKFFCELYDGTFLHYRAGGNWNGEGFNFHIFQANKLRDVLC